MKKTILQGIALMFTITLMAQEKPNILIIHTDDLGYHDLSFTGSQLYDTPNIDALAKEAVSFSNAYSSYPRCTPSRYGMMTGTYPVNEDKGYLGGLDADKNFIKQFEKAGYYTFYVGKWHLGDKESAPMGFGYDYSYAAGEAGGISTRFYPFNKNENAIGDKAPVLNVKEDGKPGDYVSDLLTTKTLDIIKNKPKNEPFLGVLAFYAVHTPIEAKKEDIARNKQQLKTMSFEGPDYIKEGSGRHKMHQDDPVYAGMVENVDENVGRILKFLKDSNIDRNTIIVFSSDHGGLSNDGSKRERHLATSNNPLRAGKGWLYEGGIRVPLLIKWEGQLKPHQDDASIVLGMDVFPTLLDLALSQKVTGIDGQSYKKVLEGKETWEDRTVFWHSNKARPESTGDPKTSAVRSGDYKLLQFKDHVELYDVKKDISESHDLSQEEPKKAKDMLKTLRDWKNAYLVPEKMDMWRNHAKEEKAKEKKAKNIKG
ncbi:MAG: sulfatase [Cytophagaceae bacterium]|nr:sulfatase [Cytophagaceae bacterium]